MNLKNDWTWDIPKLGWVVWAGFLLGATTTVFALRYWPGLVALSGPATLVLFIIGGRHGLWDSRG